MKLNVVIFNFIIICVQWFGGCNCVMGYEYYLIANGSTFDGYTLDGQEWRLSGELKFEGIWNYAWPSYYRSANVLYFEGQDKETYKTNIYKYSRDEKPQIVQLIEGRLPSLSTDGQWLTYYRHPNQLWLFDIGNRQTRKIADDMENYQPPVWISPSRILYYSVNKQLVLLDTATSDKKTIGHEKIIPGALSPDGKLVLCGSYDGQKIYLYTIETNTTEVIKENKFLGMHSRFIWRPDGKGFFYLGQRWSTILTLREGYSLFLFSLVDRTEIHLPGGHFFGGVENFRLGE